MSCSHPKVINNRLVPCGCCVNCRRRRQNDWAVRLDIERKLYKDKSLFITLTYDNEHLPQDGLLNKRDYQLFLKRLRRRIEPLKIRYFLSGEYGDKFGRPHFHLILFGLGLTEENIDIINKSWSNGFTSIFPVTWKNCRYVAKYSVKQFQKEKTGFKVDNFTGEVQELLVSEFVRMSRDCGLGFGIFNNKDMFKKYISKDGLITCGDYCFSIPRSFKKKINEIDTDYLDRKFVILYNDKQFKDINDFRSSCYWSFNVCLKNVWNIKDLKNVEFVTFKDYLKSLRIDTVREENFCKLRKIDYFQFYYKKLFRFFPFIFDSSHARSAKIHFWLFNFLKENKIDPSYSWSYHRFFEDFLYSNFDFLFY